MNTIKKNNDFRPLFIGFGKQAQEYAKALNSKKIFIHSIFIRNKKKNIKIENKYKINYIFNNLKSALNDERYTHVFVFLPWNIIEKKIEFIIKNSKKIIFCEKPLALSVKKLKKIIFLLKKKKIKLHVLYNRRYYLAANKIRNKLKNKKIEYQITIPEKINIYKKYDKKLKYNIKYHLTSHWIDFFTYVLNKKITKIERKAKNYYIYLNNNNKNKSYIKIIYNGNGYIKAKIKENNKIYLFDTLERVYLKKNKKKKLIFNEYKENKFKPGIDKLLDDIIINKKTILPEPKNLTNLYYYIDKLPY
jgi:predicted dehydrogenase